MTARGMLFSRVVAMLESWRWDVSIDRTAPDGIGRALLEPPHSAPPWPLMVAVYERPKRVLFYSIWPDPVPVRDRERMTEALTRVNDGLIGGAAEMSIDDGDLKVRTAAAFGDVEPPTEVFAAAVREALDDNLSLAGRYFPAFEAVIARRADPADAIATVERP